MNFNIFKLVQYLLLILTLNVSLVSCSTYHGIKLSRLSINSKTRNGLIINRYPDYGDGHPDGCIVLAEMNVRLNMNRGATIISGFVTDVYNADTLRKASILLEDATGHTSTLTTDSNGRFLYNSATRIQSISISSVAYRQFLARF